MQRVYIYTSARTELWGYKTPYKLYLSDFEQEIFGKFMYLIDDECLIVDIADVEAFDDDGDENDAENFYCITHEGLKCMIERKRDMLCKTISKLDGMLKRIETEES